MGQEIGVTPLQMAVAYSVIANGGNWVKPHVLREMRSPDGSSCSGQNLNSVRR